MGDVDRLQSELDSTTYQNADIVASLPRVHSLDYFTEPSAEELIGRECLEAGYCSRVLNFTVGRLGYGYVKFFGETDARWLDIERTVEFNSCEVWVYKDEKNKPPIGKGLNKAAEVALFLKADHLRRVSALEDKDLDNYIARLKRKTEQQGAQFISFNAFTGEWKFLVQHFSRFGLDDDDDDEDEVHSDIAIEENIRHLDELEEAGEIHGEGSAEETNFEFLNTEMSEIPEEENPEDQMALDEIQATSHQRVLSHSLPEHLRLDPVKMQEMKMLFFSADEEAEDIAMPGTIKRSSLGYKHSYKTTGRKASQRSMAKESVYQTGLQRSLPKASVKNKASPHTTWQHSLYSGRVANGYQGLLEYSKDMSPSILMTQQNKGEHPALKRAKTVGFSIDAKTETPVSTHSRNVVDAALFMGRSFRVGWGPNGLLVHSGTVAIQAGHAQGLSSLINIEKVAIDQIIRDDQAKVNNDLIDLQFISPLKLHMPMSRVLVGSKNNHQNLKLRDLVCSRFELPDVCQGYQELIEKLLNAPGLSRSKRIVLMHQRMVWHLLSVLFSERDTNSSTDNDKELDGMTDEKDGSMKMDPEAEPLIRRAQFSGWLQESVSHRVQEEVDQLMEGSELEQIFSLLTSRQLDEAVQLAAYRGDVRMACLISQAGGSISTRKDMAAQLEIWNTEGLDFGFIEKDWLKLYKLLAGDIQGALGGAEVDWKRYLGLLMWYDLPPDTSLPIIIKSYQQLVDQGVAPPPVPIYTDEGPLEEAPNLNAGGYYDLSYYLMLLHANDGKDVNLNKMFSSFTSTYDALDYHMIWHQQAILQAIGVIDYKEPHLLTMSFVSQLLCLGECHWAIYVVLHMPPNQDHPMLHEKLIKEILCQYCETWSSVEMQKKFIEELSIPPEWMHEALAMHRQYSGDSMRALEHFLKSLQWQRAHLLFMTSVAPTLFFSSQHSEIWRLASSMEGHKSEIADWDLGAGIYMDFYTLRRAFQDNQFTAELDSLEKKNVSCRNFNTRVKEALCLWRSRFPLNARVTFSKMADEVANLLMSENKGDMHTRSLQMSCFETIVDAPVPEDLRLCRLQDAVSVFTSCLSEVTS